MAARSFVGAYILLQLAVAIFAIRYWPLTDYPMFSNVHRRFEEIESFRLRGVKFDGTEEWLHRGMTSNFGHADFKIRTNLTQGDVGRARELVVEHLKSNSAELKRHYRRVKVVERTLTRTAEGFQVEDRPLFDVPTAGLE